MIRLGVETWRRLRGAKRHDKHVTLVRFMQMFPIERNDFNRSGDVEETKRSAAIKA